MPSFNYQQSDYVYYYSLLSIFNLGMVDHANKGCDGVECNHLHTHIYHEGAGKKGANNVASLIIKMLKLLELLDKSCARGELSIIFDNCTGQKKNNTVLKLLI